MDVFEFLASNADSFYRIFLYVFAIVTIINVLNMYLGGD